MKFIMRHVLSERMNVGNKYFSCEQIVFFIIKLNTNNITVITN